jgi:hypothetical protein
MTLFHIIPHRVGSNRDTQCTPASFDRHIRTQLHIFWVEWTHLLFQGASRFRPLLGMPRLLGGTQGVLPPPTILHDGQTSIHHGLERPNHLLVYNRGLPLLIISSGDTPASTAVGGTPTAFWVATGVSPGLQIFIMGGPAYTTVGGTSSAFLATTESVRKHSLPYHSTFPVSVQGRYPRQVWCLPIILFIVSLLSMLSASSQGVAQQSPPSVTSWPPLELQQGLPGLPNTLRGVP